MSDDDCVEPLVLFNGDIPARGSDGSWVWNRYKRWKVQPVKNPLDLLD